MLFPRTSSAPPDDWGVDFAGAYKLVTGATEVTSQVTPIPAGASGGPGAARGRRRLFIRNHVPFDFVGPTLFVGGRDVTKTSGYPVAANELLELSITDRVGVYGVSESVDEPVEVRTLEVV